MFTQKKFHKSGFTLLSPSITDTSPYSDKINWHYSIKQQTRYVFKVVLFCHSNTPLLHSKHPSFNIKGNTLYSTKRYSSDKAHIYSEIAACLIEYRRLLISTPQPI